MTEVVAISLIAVLFLLAWGVPVGVVLALTGMFGTIAITGTMAGALNMASLVTYGVASSYTFMVVPMFIAMGVLASYAGISSDLFEAAHKNMGRLPGGLAVATTFTAAGFAAITGSSMSSCATLTKIALPEMNRLKYNPSLSIGCITNAATLAIMIPPSTTLVIYAIFADQSVGALLLAGIIPGLFTTISFVLLILGRARLNPSLGPQGPTFPWKVRLASLAKVLPFLFLLAAILFGILFGLWSPVEASAAGVVVVLFMGIVRKTLAGKQVFAAMRETTVTCASVFLVVIGSLIYAKFLVISGVSVLITESIVGWGLPSWVMFVVLVILYIILGCFLEAISMMALTVPIVVPIVIQLGWSPIWFGIVLTLLIEIAQVTPPVGMSLFVVKAMVPELPMNTIIRGSLFFIPCELSVLAILYFFPKIALWLPGMMG